MLIFLLPCILIRKYFFVLNFIFNPTKFIILKGKLDKLLERYFCLVDLQKKKITR